MFDIKPYNKILITQGDTASFTVDIVDLDDDTYEPAETDVLELNVFTEVETILTKHADFIDGSWVFSLFNNDTKNIAPSVYNYNVILYKDGEPYTIIQTTAFEVLSTVPEGVNPKPTPTPDPEPTPEPDIDIDPDPVDSSDIIVFGNPVCYEGDTITVKMRVKLMASSIQLRLAYDAEHLQMTGWSGGLGNDSITYSANDININDYSSEGAGIADYAFTFNTLATGTGFVNVSELIEITDENGNPYNDLYGTGRSVITIKQRQTASSEARLQSLSITPGTWNKAFDPDTTDYVISITPSDAELSFQYTTMDSNATVIYWPYSEAGKLVIDTEGQNEFTIHCTAQDGRTTVDYHITVLILT